MLVLLSLYLESSVLFSSLSESYTNNSFNLCCQTLADSEVLSKRKYILLSLSVWLELTSVLKFTADLSRYWDSVSFIKYAVTYLIWHNLFNKRCKINCLSFNKEEIILRRTVTVSSINNSEKMRAVIQLTVLTITQSQFSSNDNHWRC